MKEVDLNLLNEFAKVIVGKGDTKSKADANIGLYGTIAIDPITSEKCVKIDGCSSTTPIYEAMDATAGDRVLVNLKDHRAVVVGNLTAPASAKQATDFLKPFEGGGFLIGELKDGSPVVAFIVLREDEILFISANNQVMGSFSMTNTRLGHDKNSTIRICGDTGTIKHSEDGGFIFDAGDRVEIDTFVNEHYTKFINSSKNGNPYISMEVYDQNKDATSKLELSGDSIDISIPDINKFRINGFSILDLLKQETET